MGGIGAAMTIYQLCPSAFSLIMVSTSTRAITCPLMYLLYWKDGAFDAGSVGNLLNTTVQQMDSELTALTFSNANCSLPHMCSC